ncbi:hypothetical protein RRG08_054445 [Elysia crispata]|uniref:Uncharacterized protein n=1 Tax=Elysia crispata TaxID=231223 RepID=A0AAE1E5C5_9GAST|nr:hypothetical protein RRG08_054445 [Elysia crispata]
MDGSFENTESSSNRAGEEKLVWGETVLSEVREPCDRGELGERNTAAPICRLDQVLSMLIVLSVSLAE